MNIWNLDPLELRHENLRREVVAVVELQVLLGEGELRVQKISHLYSGEIQGGEPLSPIHHPRGSRSLVSLLLFGFGEGSAVAVRLQCVALIVAEPDYPDSNSNTCNRTYYTNTHST